MTHADIMTTMSTVKEGGDKMPDLNIIDEDPVQTIVSSGKYDCSIEDIHPDNVNKMFRLKGSVWIGATNDWHQYRMWLMRALDVGKVKQSVQSFKEFKNLVEKTYISAEKGDAVAFALWKLQERGRMFVSPGDRLYEGMVIGIHSRDNDLVVNPIKGKQLTNIRASGTDEAVTLTPPVQLTLESAIEFITDDELVEITPQNIRIRKRLLLEHERKRASRSAA